ncbi:MAG: hypothetical protein EZS28_034920, partial [Streblomastix strix]
EKDKPVLQPRQTFSGDIADQATSAFISLTGTGKLQIKEFLITHFAGLMNEALIQTRDNSVLKLTSCTLSTCQRAKTGNIIVLNNFKPISKAFPFIFGKGKQIILENVQLQPSNFKNCYGISLDGSSSGEHSFIANGCIFEELGKEEDDGGLIKSIKFTTVIKDCIIRFGSNLTVSQSEIYLNKKSNNVPLDKCEWQTSSVSLSQEVAWIDNTTFTGLSRGAIQIDQGGRVYIDKSCKFYNNAPIVMSHRIQKAERNIVCLPDSTGLSQLKVDSKSFYKLRSDGQPGEISENKWVLANPGSCQLFGTILQTKDNLLYKPYITSITAEVNQFGIIMQIKGISLIGCQLMYIEVRYAQSSVLNDGDDSQLFLLESYASKWDTDTDATAFIPYSSFILRDKKMSIRLIITNSYGGSEYILAEDGDVYETDVVGSGVNIIEEIIEEKTQKKKGLSAQAIIGIFLSVALVGTIIVIIIVACVFKRLNKMNRPELLEVEYPALQEDF